MSFEGPRRHGDEEEQVSNDTLTDLEKAERAVREMTGDPDRGLDFRRRVEKDLFGMSDEPIGPGITPDHEKSD